MHDLNTEDSQDNAFMRDQHDRHFVKETDSTIGWLHIDVGCASKVDNCKILQANDVDVADTRGSDSGICDGAICQHLAQPTMHAMALLCQGILNGFCNSAVLCLPGIAHNQHEVKVERRMSTCMHVKCRDIGRLHMHKLPYPLILVACARNSTSLSLFGH